MKDCYFTQPCISLSTAKIIGFSVVPKSFLAVDILKIGEIIKPVKEKMLDVKVKEFKIECKHF